MCAARYTRNVPPEKKLASERAPKSLSRCRRWYTVLVHKSEHRRIPRRYPVRNDPYPRPIWSDIIGATRWKGDANAGRRMRKKETVIKSRDDVDTRSVSATGGKGGEGREGRVEKGFYENRSGGYIRVVAAPSDGGPAFLHVGVVRSAPESAAIGLGVPPLIRRSPTIPRSPSLGRDCPRHYRSLAPRLAVLSHPSPGGAPNPVSRVVAAGCRSLPLPDSRAGFSACPAALTARWL